MVFYLFYLWIQTHNGDYLMKPIEEIQEQPEVKKKETAKSKLNENNFPVLDIEMLSVDEIKKSPGGINYVLRDVSRKHITQLAEIINTIFARPAILNDDEFKNSVIIEVSTLKKCVDELYSGMEFLSDVLRKNGMVK